MNGERADDLPRSDAAERNKQPILDALARILPAAGLVLEIASGTGQHVVHFAAALPRLTFQPSEADPAMRDAARRRIAAARLPNVREPIALDVLNEPWPIECADAVFVANLLHIAPWSVVPALFRNSAALLPEGAPLTIYGPFLRADVPTAPSNAAFDVSLKARDRSWGIRSLEEVQVEAARHGFALAQILDMPANNLVVVFRR